MIRNARIIGALVLSVSLAATAQTTKPATPTKTHRKSHDEELQERLEKLEVLTGKYDQLQDEVDDIKRQLAASNAALEASRAEAAQEAAKVQALQSAQQATAPQAEALASLQTSVADLTSKATSMALLVETTQKKTEVLEKPEQIHFKGIDLTPGGMPAVVSHASLYSQKASCRTPPCAATTKPTSSPPELLPTTTRATATPSVSGRSGRKLR
jgi:hypothetical protein